jgi:hypothetical protein
MRDKLLGFGVVCLGVAQSFAQSPQDLEHIFGKYDYVDPEGIVPERALKIALDVYDRYQDSFPNKGFITVIDFTAHSGKRRFYVINMKDGSVEDLHTAHGEGSDKDDDGIAEKFSNVNDSKTSSLGVYRTAETYDGKNGYSLKLDGLSDTNSNVRSRSIVVHGAKYVNSSKSKMGRSWGCPALQSSLSTRIIKEIKEGSLMYAWAGE